MKNLPFLWIRNFLLKKKEEEKKNMKRKRRVKTPKSRKLRTIISLLTNLQEGGEDAKNMK
jgi:hypothetical protein